MEENEIDQQIVMKHRTDSSLLLTATRMQIVETWHDPWFQFKQTPSKDIRIYRKCSMEDVKKVSFSDMGYLTPISPVSNWSKILQVTGQRKLCALRTEFRMMSSLLTSPPSSLLYLSWDDDESRGSVQCSLWWNDLEASHHCWAE